MKHFLSQSSKKCETDITKLVETDLVIPHRIMIDEELKGSDKMTLACIIMQTMKGNCMPSNKELSIMVGLAERHIAASISRLQAKGYISTRRVVVSPRAIIVN